MECKIAGKALWLVRE